MVAGIASFSGMPLVFLDPSSGERDTEAALRPGTVEHHCPLPWPCSSVWPVARLENTPSLTEALRCKQKHISPSQSSKSDPAHHLRDCSRLTRHNRNQHRVLFTCPLSPLLNSPREPEPSTTVWVLLLSLPHTGGKECSR